MQKDIFLMAAVLTVIVFVLGIGMGIWLDNDRVSAAGERLTEIDLQWNDARLQGLFYGNLDGKGCAAAMEANLEFNDKIYAEGKTIENYEQINRFAPQLLQEKKRYALLQLQFWLNSIDLKGKCGANYTTVVYFYSHYDRSLETEQEAQSAVLTELKKRCGNSVLLIPLPTDIGLTSVDMILKSKGVTKAPSILVNESKVLPGLQNLPYLEGLIQC